MEAKPWLKLYPESIPTTLDYEEKPVQTYLTEAARKYPDKVAVHFMGKEMTYRQVYESALRLSNYLISIGIKKGDRVAIMLPNSPQGVISYYGILYAGGIVVQTNPLYTERELEYQINDSRAKAIISLDILYPRISKVLKHTKLDHVIITAIKDYLPFPKNLIYPFIQKKQTGIVVQLQHEGNVHPFKKIRCVSQPEPHRIEFDFENDLALLQYTGGTTGRPKGVMLTHNNLIDIATACDAWLYNAKKGEEKILCLLPFFNVYGMTTVLILAVMQGYKMILLPKFEVETTLKTIHKQRPTIFPGAPTIYIGLLNHPDLSKYDLTSIESC